jgi:hypothetical protein
MRKVPKYRLSKKCLEKLIGVKMHYLNGRTAKAGDVVKGKGYNIQYEIVGLLIYANPTSSACNCQVATVTKDSQFLHHGFPQSEPRSDGSIVFKGMEPPSFYGVIATIEYGQLDAFVAIDPKTGEVLPKE